MSYAPELTFTTVTTAWETAQQLECPDVCTLEGILLEMTVAAGTQFEVQFSLGYTGSLEHMHLVTVTMPAVAGDFSDPDFTLGRDAYRMDPPTRIHIDKTATPDLYDSVLAAMRAGYGVYVRIKKTAGTDGATVKLVVDIGPEV